MDPSELRKIMRDELDWYFDDMAVVMRKIIQEEIAKIPRQYGSPPVQQYIPEYNGRPADETIYPHGTTTDGGTGAP